ncbi:site-specific integrase [Tropicimonas sp. IMCC6043]|uniref:tyrosine-type recombinase/integrase n=1 Tax=Tropicimonas sp. IMCC6043 TaxID=2510645 RepID=UPI00101B89B0|nr:tyrosine-type recombinase/integrase [Tropicimonas sp. IMCC6043]RYH07779.1 DUF4102 domain-containing protein [Tropicimonas sp. IMCC6043]
MDDKKPASLRGKAKRIKIDSRVVAAALKRRATGCREVIADAVTPGLRLKVGPRGGSYTYTGRARGHRPDGTRHPVSEFTLGHVDDLTPAQARAAVEELQAVLAQGRDPKAEVREAKAKANADARARQTIRQVADRYLRSQQNWTDDDRERRAQQTEHQRQESLHVLRGIEEMGAGVADLWIGDMTMAHLQGVLDLHTGKPATARHRGLALDKFARWAMRKGYMPTNPFDGYERPKPPKPRQRQADAADVQALWNASDLPEVMHAFTRLAMLVPLRAGELAELEPGNIDLERSAIVLDGKETKNGDPFTIPLASSALEIVQQRLAVTGERERLFQLNGAGGPMNAWNNYNRRVRKYAPGFHLHDIRRLFVSVLAEQGVGDADTTDSLLNHRQSETRSGVRAHYHQARLWPRQVRVMRAWADLVSYAVEHAEWPPMEFEDDVVVALGSVR